MAPYDLIVAGGGAAGFFGAITCAEFAPGARILILEKSSQVLGKVKISGGGRCNVTHACFDPRELVTFYPRGSKQLIGPFNRWAPGDTMDWFESRGVPLKIETDNRVFPTSNSSQSIIDCLTDTATAAGIEIRTSTAIETVESLDEEEGFLIHLTDSAPLKTKRFLLTTGGTRSPIGAKVAESFGHQVEPAAPSLFTFKISDPRIEGLQGLSVPNAHVKVRERDCVLEATGPVLVTHWGLSGPAILRVSAWGARNLQRTDYRFEVSINWSGTLTEHELFAEFDRLRVDSPKKTIGNDPQFGIPARLWKSLAARQSELRWPHLPREAKRDLAQEIGNCRFSVDGKSMNKDEFVTCGGISLREVQFKTMESRLTPGLHFAGEVLDIDGITGGFNFQSAWATGHIAGEAIANQIEL